VVVDPAVLPVVVPFVDEPVVVPLAASAPAAEFPLAEPVPLCATANEPVSANVAANAIVATFIVVSLALLTKDNSPSTSSVPLVFSAMEPPSCSHRRVYAAAIVSHRVSLGLELALDVAMSVEPVALHSLKLEAISTCAR
jgi:hypothetical protein